MKVGFRDLYSDCIEELIWDCVEIDLMVENLKEMAEPVKHIYINNSVTKYRLALIPTTRPIIIPFKVGKYYLSLGNK